MVYTVVLKFSRKLDVVMDPISKRCFYIIHNAKNLS